MKEVFLRLCDHPIIIEQGNKSFWLDKWTGKKCYMLAARQLSIALFDSPTCWRWTSMEKSRFTEVAELISVRPMEVIGNVNTSILSPNTTYVAQLVFMTTSKAYGFEYQPAEVCIGPFGDNSQTRMVYLDPHARTRRRLLRPRGVGSSRRGVLVVPAPSEDNCSKLREDGWFEVEIGEYFNKGGEEIEVEMSVVEIKGGNSKSGLIIQGIEIKPKHCV
ncbi:putative phloem protein [Helianthus annuus]|nr:putative phloem protein [Helianthus annuus]